MNLPAYFVNENILYLVTSKIQSLLAANCFVQCILCFLTCLRTDLIIKLSLLMNVNSFARME